MNTIDRNPCHLSATRGTSALVASLAALLLSACVTTSTSSIPTANRTTGPWLEPTPELRDRIEDAAKRLPWTHGMERVELIQWFAGVGEPAYPTLLGMVLDPRRDVATASLAALGATRDSRLVDHLHALPWPTEPDTDFTLERARTLLRLGDWGMVPHLIQGLRDDRLLPRALCVQALWEATHERFGYDPRADANAREEAIQRWEGWWKGRNGDPLLKSSRAAPSPGPQPSAAKVSLQDP